MNFLHPNISMESVLPEEHLGKKLVRQTFRVYFFTLLAAPLGYIIRAVIANKLSIEDVGIFYSVLWFVTILASINDLGLTEAMQYYLPKYRIQKKYDSYKTTLVGTFLIQIITGIIGLIFLYWAAPWLSVHHFQDPQALILLRVFAWYFVLINIFQLITAYCTAFQNTFLAHFLNFFKQLTLLGRIGYFWWSTWAVTLGDVAHAWLRGMGVLLVVAGVLFRRSYGSTLYKGTIEFETKQLREQFTYAWGVLLANNAGLLIGLLDQQFVINVLWPQAAGIYANYLILLVVYGVVSGPFLALIFPIVTELVTKEQHAKYTLFLNLLYKYYAVFALGVAWIFFALWPELAMVFFGTKFIYSGVLASYISPVLVLNILLAVNFTFLAWLGRVHERARLLGGALLVNVIATILGLYVFNWWIISPLIATAVSRGLLWRGSWKALITYQPLTFPWRYWMKNLLVVGMLSIILRWAKDTVLIVSNAFRYSNIAWIVGGIVFYSVILWLVNYSWVRALIQQLKVFRQSSSHE